MRFFWVRVLKNIRIEFWIMSEILKFIDWIWEEMLVKEIEK